MNITRPRYLRPAAALLTGGALLFATACSAGSSSTPSDSAASADKDKTINIVASTSIWADVAKAVANTANGVTVNVDPIVKGNSVDPHHFEPTAADIARANDADVVIVNGGGYDSWIYQAVSDQDHIISALPLTDHGKLDDEPDVVTPQEAKDIAKQDPSKITNIEGNEHIWYDSAAIEKVATEVEDLINDKDPEAGATRQPLVDKMEALRGRVEELPKLNYAQTEPIADYIMKYTPATDVTPEGFRKATISEGEPTAADLARFLEVINEGKVDLLIYNPQTETDISQRIHDAAEEKNIPIVEIAETPSEETSFLDYYSGVIDSLQKVKA
ncbi:MAG: metal ABC transporter solute-binding protein, Zn/Mn family [Corynebacterium flavescens]|uniref:metal ABC transporter solute-binding protein, Zn/Mn family n=1 Tax=Corynebacterium flavescens TaxID=28028 RepID=UPI003F8FB9C6